MCLLAPPELLVFHEGLVFTGAHHLPCVVFKFHSPVERFKYSNVKSSVRFARDPIATRKMCDTSEVAVILVTSGWQRWANRLSWL